ncbi:MAG: hypothetical protein ACOYEF_07430 [Planifilum sp.]|jgi:hypothetical protein
MQLRRLYLSRSKKTGSLHVEGTGLYLTYNNRNMKHRWSQLP